MSLKLKIKINNSYESESGCGSSISENNDYSSIYDDDQLDYIIKPPSYSNEVTITTTTTPMAPESSLHTNDSSISSSSQTSKDSVLNSKDKREMIFGIPLHSSQESSFEGFGNSPFDKLQRIFYPQQPSSLIAANVATAADSSESKSQMAPRKPSPGKIVFTKFYDTIVEENSCNAVDIQMSSNDPALPLRRSSSSSSMSNQIDANPSSELSFNGKIKSLNKQYETLDMSMEPQNRLPPVLETSLNSSQQFSESFILKKYSNEKSPDLFGDDDDDDEEEDEEAEDCGEHGEVTTKVEIQILNTITEDPTANEMQKTTSTTCLNETNENNSFNCPVDGSFANDDYTMDCSLTQTSNGLGNTGTDPYSLFRENCRREREMLRRIRKCLAGVLPPPSVTIPQLDMFNAVLSRKDELLNYFDKSPQKTKDEQQLQAKAQRVPSLFKPTHTLDETKSMPWRDILGVRQHGLSYNLNKASESNEYLSLSIMERFIGAETASSYQNSPSSAKKRSSRMKLLCQSPGNRLSHLAKRRAIFSSAHLATTSQKSSTLLGPQIVLDKKKPKNRRKATPKRMTPGSKKKNRKTPSSSARKRLFRSDIIKPGPSRETSKRALFQSPAKHVQQRASLPRPPPMKPELANRVEKSKRALLFTPEKQQQQHQIYVDQKPVTTTENTYFAPYNSSQLESLLKRKRNPCDDDADDVDMAVQNSKLMKTGNSGLTPRALKIKSQSFCIGAGSSSAKSQLPSASAASRGMSTNASCSNISSSSSSQSLARASSITSLGGSKLQKSYSETSASSNSLTENQKKKLLWAVSQALQERKITAKHESFKQYAAILARVVRRIFQEYYQKNSTSNSETMLRLAKKYVYNVTSGGTADDIYLQAKSQIDETKRQSTSRLSGYIGPEEYQQLKKQQLSQQSSQSLSQASSSFSHKVSSLNIFNGDSSFDSFGPISQNTSGFCSGNNTGLSQTSNFLGHISQDIIMETSQSSNTKSGKKLIDPNKSLPNSSSKSNIYADALRENMDCDVRNSAQKNFTGKDQRNMIQYAGNGGGGSAVKAHTQLVTEIITNSAKARRQITFDT
ncbi:cyclin E-interacting protein minus [Musca autumnalis]|uniref:cyclin E-interacting protein minus n=1 Tax=Musca autumnalis TaxID=221902 RepID=UPI003CEA2D57